MYMQKGLSHRRGLLVTAPRQCGVIIAVRVVVGLTPINANENRSAASVLEAYP